MGGRGETKGSRRTGRLALVLAAIASLPSPGRARAVAQARDQVVSETLRYLNIPYLWGGVHPDTGLDCSSFVQLVFRGAGFGLPRVSREQFAATGKVKPDRVLPGDLVFFAMKHPGTARVDHVGIYMGRGFFVHASVSNGIHVDQVAKPYFMDRLVGVRRFRGF